MADLSGKVAVVTGAASGIGYSLAERWAREGMKVVRARFWILPNAESLIPAIKEVALSAVEGRRPPMVQPS